MRRIRPPGALYEDLAEAAARDHLAREFPRVPKLILVAMLPASGRETPSVGLAERAARDRLRDACSIRDVTNGPVGWTRPFASVVGEVL